jgi:hypothetical protein
MKLINFDLNDWRLAMMLGGLKRGNGKYNSRRMYQGFATLTLNRKPTRKCINHGHEKS